MVIGQARSLTLGLDGLALIQLEVGSEEVDTLGSNKLGHGCVVLYTEREVGGRGGGFARSKVGVQNK